MSRSAFYLLCCSLITAAAAKDPQFSEAAAGKAAAGKSGGRLVIAQRAEPKTLNPIFGLDVISRELTGLLTADLIHLDRGANRPAPAIASRWTVSKDQRRYVLHLLRGVRFSDGHAFDADDVLFTFQVHLDEKTGSPQRDLFVMDGKPLVVRKLDPYTVEFEFARPHPAVERLFDSVGILPRHLLERSYREGKLTTAWGLMTPANAIAGLGPFRFKSYVPGERLVLERNPHYWKTDANSVRLPYLDEIEFLFVGNEEAQSIRFRSSETHVIAGLSPENYAALERTTKTSGNQLLDLGPGLEYSFLLFNLNGLQTSQVPAMGQKQAWFRQQLFRKAVSAAIDREALVRLVYRGKASPLWAHVSAGNKTWVNRDVAKPPRSLDRARQLLREAGFSWSKEGRLLDPASNEVSFSIMTSAGNTQRAHIATIIQDDLKQLGMKVSIVALEFRAMLDRVFRSHEYEAAVMTLASGDTDPNSDMNVWTVKGSTHLWNLNGGPAEDWELEIDGLMREQMTQLNPELRKRLYDRVQFLVATRLPIVSLLSPHVLVGASERLGNFRPSILRPYALWNADELYFRGARGPVR